MCFGFALSACTMSVAFPAPLNIDVFHLWTPRFVADLHGDQHRPVVHVLGVYLPVLLASHRKQIQAGLKSQFLFCWLFARGFLFVGCLLVVCYFLSGQNTQMRRRSCLGVILCFVGCCLVACQVGVFNGWWPMQNLFF